MTLRVLALLLMSFLTAAAIAGEEPWEFHAGTFEHLDANGHPSGWELFSGANIKMETENGSRFVTIATRNAADPIAIRANVALKPEWKSLQLSVRVRAKLNAGESARVRARFEDAAGNELVTIVLAERTESAEWAGWTTLAEIPPESVRVVLEAGLGTPAGVMSVDDLRIIPRTTTARPIPVRAGILPQGEMVQWGAEPVEVESATRARICLNGLWRFNPAPTPEPDPTDLWGYIYVPGSWQSVWYLPGIVVRGEGPSWKAFEPKTLTAGWYERPIAVPADWNGRTIELELANVCSNAEVFVDGVRCGEVAWLGGRVDLSKHARAGKESQLRVRVKNAASPPPPLSDTPAGAGLMGDVILSSRPAAARIENVRIETSVRRKELTVHVDVVGAIAGEAKVTAVLLNEKGVEEKRFTIASPALAPTQTFTWPWPDPRLWDLEQPNLYALRLEMSAPGWSDAAVTTFGFREFWVEGRAFFLNGTEIRLRPVAHPDPLRVGGTQELMDGAIDGFRAAGFNILALPPRPESPGHWEFWDLWCERADRKGWALIVPAEARVRCANHPSVLMWNESAPAASATNDDPVRVGTLATPPSGKPQPTIALGAGRGEIFSASALFQWVPLQERSEWFDAWAEKGNAPLMLWPTGTPELSAVMRGRDARAETSEPLLTEYCAAVLGNEAYDLERAELRQSLRSRFLKEDTYKSWLRQPLLYTAPAYQRLQALFIQESWRAWRMAGISGGMAPLDLAWGWSHPIGVETGREPLAPFAAGRRGTYQRRVPSHLLHFLPDGETRQPAGASLVGNNGPTLAFIAGPKDVVASKDHSYHAGQTISKLGIIINDMRTEQRAVWKWRATVNGAELRSGAGETVVPLASRAEIPIAFPTGDAPGSCELAWDVSIAGHEHSDRFSFRVFNKSEPLNLDIVQFDGAGQSKSLLESLGCKASAWDGGQSPALLVIGRNALTASAPFPGNLESFVRNGGRVLVLAQEAEWYRRALGLRVAETAPRRAFAVSPAHPALAGLTDADLRDWAGSGLLRSTPGRTEKDGVVYPQRRGNRGALSAGAIEKPHRSGWRPILECEFDLAYSPLMELDFGRGRLILCTLDLEDFVPRDAAATALARQLFDYAARAPLTSKPDPDQVVFIGSAKEAAMLDGLGVVYRKAEVLAKDAQLLIVGEDAALDEATLEAYLKQGGRALFLPIHRREAPLGVTMLEFREVDGMLSVPRWEECRGLSYSDLRWRAPWTAWLNSPRAPVPGSDFEANRLLARKTVGRGVAIFAQIDPNRFDADKNTMFRLTRWRQTRALCQVLANMGATFHMDRRFFAPGDFTAETEKRQGGWYHSDYRSDFERGDDPYRFAKKVPQP